MVHVDYDSTLVIVSILVAVVTCYAAVSMIPVRPPPTPEA